MSALIDGTMPLNPNLYMSLRARFNAVRIANEGGPFRGHVVIDPMTKRPKTYAVESGEYYRVNCPYCGDTRFRLYFNHMWNTVDKDGKHGYRWMVCCFNEGCDTSKLENELKLYINVRAKPQVAQDRPATEMFKETSLPGICVDLNKLPETHPAIQYIRGRNFDPAELQRDWGVVYCESAPADDNGRIPGTDVVASLVVNRLVVPVYWQSKLVGWQARATNEWHKPKYYTMPGLNKNHMLFNGDRAAKFRFGVVVEGVFDAFRVGARAAALLGKSLSYHQRTLVHTYWGSGALCLMLDPEAAEEMDNIEKMLVPGSFRWGAFKMVLPDQRDPAEWDRESLWNMIAAYARNRGIELASV